MALALGAVTLFLAMTQLTLAAFCLIKMQRNKNKAAQKEKITKSIAQTRNV